MAANERAFRQAEKKAAEQLRQVRQQASQITAVRRSFWFEKFRWFVTTDNYLVLSGRDMQQNEMLVKRYLKRGDLYVHADVHGAATTVGLMPPLPC